MKNKSTLLKVEKSKNFNILVTTGERKSMHKHFNFFIRGFTKKTFKTDQRKKWHWSFDKGIYVKFTLYNTANQYVYFYFQAKVKGKILRALAVPCLGCRSTDLKNWLSFLSRFFKHWKKNYYDNANHLPSYYGKDISLTNSPIRYMRKETRPRDCVNFYFFTGIERIRQDSRS